MPGRPKLIIDRQKWSRGDGPSLMNSSTAFSCLGFACLQNGLTEDDILYSLMPSDVSKLLISLGDKFNLLSPAIPGKVYVDSPLSIEASAINDNASISDGVREEKLIILFSKSDIDVVFIN